MALGFPSDSLFGHSATQCRSCLQWLYANFDFGFSFFSRGSDLTDGLLVLQGFGFFAAKADP